MKTSVLAVLCSVISLAADVAGRWSGDAKIPSPEGQRTQPVCLILKSEGSTVTGSVGEDEVETRPIQNGKLQGDTLTFEVPTDEATYRVTLKLDGDFLTGEAAREGQTQTIKMSLKRAKPAQ
jgi:hypothetical protein